MGGDHLSRASVGINSVGKGCAGCTCARSIRRPDGSVSPGGRVPFRRHQTCYFRERATSAPAELAGESTSRRGICNVSRDQARVQVRPKAQKLQVYGSGTFGAFGPFWPVLRVATRAACASSLLLHDSPERTDCFVDPVSKRDQTAFHQMRRHAVHCSVRRGQHSSHSLHVLRDVSTCLVCTVRICSDFITVLTNKLLNTQTQAPFHDHQYDRFAIQIRVTQVLISPGLIGRLPNRVMENRFSKPPLFQNMFLSVWQECVASLSLTCVHHARVHRGFGWLQAGF